MNLTEALAAALHLLASRDPHVVAAVSVSLQIKRIALMPYALRGHAWWKAAGDAVGFHETGGYTLTDRGTFLSRQQKGDLVVMVENDPPLFNPYAIIATNPARHPAARYIAAMQLIAWLTSPEGQRRIASYQIGGRSLFVPTAVP